MSFRENLRAARKAAGYESAKDFSDRLGISYTTYMNYESKGREPKYDRLCKIAAALVVTTDELLGHNGESVWRSNYEAAQRQLDAIREFLK